MLEPLRPWERAVTVTLAALNQRLALSCWLTVRGGKGKVLRYRVLFSKDYEPFWRVTALYWILLVITRDGLADLTLRLTLWKRPLRLRAFGLSIKREWRVLAHDPIWH